jgi:Uma2 family endonuclease
MPTVTDADLPLHRLGVESYDRMVASGALEGAHLELLDGLLVSVSPHSPAHAAVIEALTEHFAHSGLCMRVQLPLRIPPDCEPEPDIALLARRPSPEAHPSTALLVVEVSVASHRLDRGRKAERYAQAEIPTYWLVDIPGRTLEVRTQPGPHGYERCETYREGALVPAPLDGVADLDIAALLTDVAA